MQDILLNNFVAIPRLHTQFQEEGVQVIDPFYDPLQKGKNSVSVFPDFPWDTVVAKQCLYDFKQNAIEFAKDKKGALQSFDAYSLQKAKTTLSQEEITALMAFTGEKNIQSSYNPLEILQQILILAFYKEEQYLELQELSQKIQAQQEKLNLLLDDENATLVAENNEYLPQWKYVFYAILAFTQKNTEYFINDKEMAQTFFMNFKERFQLKEIEEKEYYWAKLEKQDFLSFVPENFKEFIQQTSITVVFTTNFVK